MKQLLIGLVCLIVVHPTVHEWNIEVLRGNNKSITYHSKTEPKRIKVRLHYPKEGCEIMDGWLYTDRDTGQEGVIPILHDGTGWELVPVIVTREK